MKAAQGNREKLFAQFLSLNNLFVCFFDKGTGVFLLFWSCSVLVHSSQNFCVNLQRLLFTDLLCRRFDVAPKPHSDALDAGLFSSATLRNFSLASRLATFAEMQTVTSCKLSPRCADQRRVNGVTAEWRSPRVKVWHRATRTESNTPPA